MGSTGGILARMAYDEELAARVRHLLAGLADVTERAMFGGLAFLVDGHMALAVSGRSVLMVRADQQTEARLLERPGVGNTLMRGRPMRGWLDVGASVVADDEVLADLVSRAVAHARTLPRK